LLIQNQSDAESFGVAGFGSGIRYLVFLNPSQDPDPTFFFSSSVVILCTLVESRQIRLELKTNCIS
jgi:hypothetical protein